MTTAKLSGDRERRWTVAMLVLAYAVIGGCVVADARALSTGAQAHRDAGKARAGSDERIAARLRQAYRENELLKGSAIDVACDAGRVRLGGSVPSEVARLQALAIARATKGVREIDDQLQVVVPE